MALAVWLLLGERFRAGAALFSGILLAGGGAAAAIGIVLLPYSLVGLIIGIGLIGFVPFLTAAAFVQCGIEAHYKAKSSTSTPILKSLTLFGFMFALAAPVLAQTYVSLSLRAAIQGIAQGDRSSVVRLQFWYSLAGIPDYHVDNPDHFETLDPIAQAYGDENDPARKRRLARYYRDLTGKELDFASTRGQ